MIASTVQPPARQDTGENQRTPQFTASAEALQALAENDLRQAAFHEAGHLLAARYFGLDSWCVLTWAGQASLETRSWIGEAIFCQATPHQRSVISWAGTCSESLLEDPELDDLETIYTELFEGDALSLTDRCAILAQGQGRNRPWRNLQKAARILIENRETLEEIVSALLSAWAVVPGSNGKQRYFPWLLTGGAQ